MGKISILITAAMLLIASLSEGQDVEHDRDLRVGIAALQGGNASYPEYVRIFQLGRSRAEVQWAYIEKEQGVYDFTIMDEKLEEIKQLNRNAIIKLNANRKPDWLFEIVPYTTQKLSGAIDDPQGTLMYWHPTFIDAHEKLLIAFGEYLETTPYRDIITGIRMSYNALGVEHTDVPESHWPLDKWIIPEAVDPETVEAYTTDVPDQYRETVLGFFVEHILPYSYVWTRTNLPDDIINKYQEYYEDGRLGFFHTGSSMEQNQIYNQTHRYSRFIEYCRTGKTMGFTEVDGYHNYTARYSADEIFKMTQFNYWRMLSEIHSGVSLAGVHEHMFIGQLEPNGPTLNFFDVQEMDAGWRFTDKYIGLHASPKESPGAWVALRDDTGDNYQGDYTFLMEREGNNPIAPLTDNYPGVNDGSVGKRKVGSELVRFGAWARSLPSGKTMTFHVDPRVFSPGERRIARVVYFDKGFGTWELKQSGDVKMFVNNQDTGEWIEKEVLITTDGDQFEITNIGLDDVIFHMLEVKRDGSPSSDQSSYEGTNHTIPGLIEAEYYDEGGQNVAYYDDTIKQGDLSFRPEDDVDVVVREDASNGYVVSYTSEGEWLEYTVDVTAGMYDITLYYFCGETPGDLIVSLGGEVLKTITGFQTQDPENLDSIIVQDILIGTGGTNRILRLEFTNGAGFDLDAVKFTKQNVAVTSIILTGCPDDNIFVGNIRQLSAAVTPYYADDNTVTWESSNKSVATVSSNGLVTAISEGIATITVTTKDGEFSDSCVLNSMIEVISVTGLTIGNCPVTLLQTGGTHQLTANVAPADASDKSITWSSSNTQVAAVDTSGVVTAKSEGSVTITATTNDSGFIRTCAIGIMSTGIPVNGVEILGCPDDVLKVDSTYLLVANVAPANAGDLRVNWTSSDQTVATINENGWISTLSAGETTITATTNDGGFSSACVISVGTINNVNQSENVAKGFKVYSNPGSNDISFEFSNAGSEKKIKIYNLSGQLLAAGSTYESRFNLDIGNSSIGSILLVSITTDETTSTIKFVAL